MITYVHQSIFEQNVDAIVNAVNCVGIMGSGLALEFKRRYPAMYEDYAGLCQRKLVKAGHPYAYVAGTPLIINFPTKAHWRSPSRLQWIEDGLGRLENLCHEHAIQSLALPKLGCGRGKLAWQDVQPMIEKTFAASLLQVIVCLGNGNTEKKQ